VISATHSQFAYHKRATSSQCCARSCKGIRSACSDGTSVFPKSNRVCSFRKRLVWEEWQSTCIYYVQIGSLAELAGLIERLTSIRKSKQTNAGRAGYAAVYLLLLLFETELATFVAIEHLIDSVIAGTSSRFPSG